MSALRYRAYVQSGVDWFDEFPEHWSMPPLYARYAQVLGKMLDQNKMTGENLLSYVRNVDVQWDSVNTEDLPVIDIEPADRDRFTINNGDLLICEGGEVGRTAIWEGENGEVAFQKAIHRLRPLDDTEDIRFFYYVMRFAADMRVFLVNSNPNTIPHLTGEQLRGYRFPKPPLDEQQAISSFLDVETSKIDALVSEQRRLIELLKEKRQAVISHAVTSTSAGGGVKTVPLRYLCDIVRGSSPRPKGDPNFYGGPVPRLMVADVTRDGMYTTPQIDSLTEKGATRSRPMKKGDVIVAVSGNPGLPTILAIDACIHDGFVGLRDLSSEVFPEYLFLALSVLHSSHKSLSIGAVFQNLSTDQIRNSKVTLPSMDEQRAIVKSLSCEFGELDKLTTEAERVIELLQERRTALISAAVTGKIDVRDFALEVAV